MKVGLHKIQLLRCSQDTSSQRKHTSEQGCECLPAISLLKGRASIRIKSILGVGLGFFCTAFLYLFLGLPKCLAKAIIKCTVISQCIGWRNRINKGMCQQRKFATWKRSYCYWAWNFSAWADRRYSWAYTWQKLECTVLQSCGTISETEGS